MGRAASSRSDVTDCTASESHQRDAALKRTLENLRLYTLKSLLLKNAVHNVFHKKDSFQPRLICKTAVFCLCIVSDLIMVMCTE